MSLEKIKQVFENLSKLESSRGWSLQLLNLNGEDNESPNDVVYVSREIDIGPEDRFLKFLNQVGKTGQEKAKVYSDVRDYNGEAEALAVYKLATAHSLIKKCYRDFLSAVKETKDDEDPFEFRSAYVLAYKPRMASERILLISLHSPIVKLKGRFLWRGETFEEVTDEVLYLRSACDVLVYENTVYFLTLEGEKLFRMERKHKRVCEEKVDEVAKADIISGFEDFAKGAKSGHNPRRFLSFNQARLNALQDPVIRETMAGKFDIQVTGEANKFVASSEGAVDKIVKLLCRKGMTDPFDDDSAVEVDGARKWK